MYAGIGYDVGVYKFAFLIGLDVSFVAIITLSALFCRTGIGIFLLQFVWVFFPLLGYFSLFDLFVFLSAVSLNRNFYKTGVHDFSLVGNEIFFVKFPLELVN